ncbi:alpha/beta hydrolase fold [Geosmithia morbida]|uniref:Alpha/beta hydrolase fold n=1 Tax=Geosmithia morbida TaxID=1094350 RepID=A0A9P4YRZ7_9HYPO|nr:alpha/beta hydrolase fold [Geosmithia morbida]KAF4121452.1 alpha/beta hydrolase fold [Geosmithia morbida]
MSPPATNPPIILDPAAFDPTLPGEEFTKYEEQIRRTIAADPQQWWEVGAVEYRRRRKAGESTSPAPKLLDSGSALAVPSRDRGRTIPCRTFKPTNGSAVLGVFMHIHGGGWVLNDEEYQDEYMQSMADDYGLACVTVGYRLAPEDPFPAGPQDCFDVGDWLFDKAQSEFGAPLVFIGGESAGAHLSLQTALHLIRSKNYTVPGGLILHYGCFDLGMTPSIRYLDRDGPSVYLTSAKYEKFRDAFLPGMAGDDFHRPDVSPLYEDLGLLRGSLPAALFTCGTRDILLDDTLFMSTRWLSAGAETVLEIVPGAQHAFSRFPQVPGTGAAQAEAAVKAFVTRRL